jgi:glutaminyl-tRNA synthetase
VDVNGKGERVMSNTRTEKQHETSLITNTNAEKPGKDFIRTIIEEDIHTNKYDGRVVTRFPPEPNGYLHIGHTKAFCLNFGVAQEYNGQCHLRFDDTNPEKEEVEYIDSIQEDIRWMGFDWREHLYFASDYFGRLYEYAVQLVQKGKA